MHSYWVKLKSSTAQKYQICRCCVADDLKVLSLFVFGNRPKAVTEYIWDNERCQFKIFPGCGRSASNDDRNGGVSSNQRYAFRTLKTTRYPSAALSQELVQI